MSRTLSSKLKKLMHTLSAQEMIAVLLEISHPSLLNPIRVCQYTENIVSNGNEYIALRFQFSLPDDLEQGIPSATLIIDNVSTPPEENSIAEWLEISEGGKDAQVRMMGVLPSEPDTLEFDLTLGLADVSVNITEISGRLSYEDVLNVPAVAKQYRPDTSPGLW